MSSVSMDPNQLNSIKSILCCNVFLLCYTLADSQVMLIQPKIAANHTSADRTLGYLLPGRRTPPSLCKWQSINPSQYKIDLSITWTFFLFIWVFPKIRLISKICLMETPVTPAKRIPMLYLGSCYLLCNFSKIRCLLVPRRINQSKHCSVVG